eukprot:753135-Hanusia_phi.AAC.5
MAGKCLRGNWKDGRGRGRMGEGEGGEEGGGKKRRRGGEKEMSGKRSAGIRQGEGVLKEEGRQALYRSFMDEGNRDFMVGVGGAGRRSRMGRTDCEVHLVQEVEEVVMVLVVVEKEV